MTPKQEAQDKTIKHAVASQLRECDHIPMKAALDDEIGCIRCGKWLGRAQ
jgi:hypothetical protein